MPKTEKERKLNWERYDWRDFENICFAYIKTVYSAQFYKRRLTRAQKDSGRDIVIKGKYKEFEAWGECKKHKRNTDLSIIGKNVVLALSHQIDKAIFFSVTSITLNTKIEILTVAQQYGFDVLFLDGEVLDETILSCPSVARKYFREEYEEYVEKNINNIWIDTFLSEYPFAEDAKNNTKTQYHLQNGFRVFLHVFIKNMRIDELSNITITLKNNTNSDMIFYETQYKYSNTLASHSDLMCTFRGMIFSPKKNMRLPLVEVNAISEDGSLLSHIIETGIVDTSDVWKAPYINSKSVDFIYNSTYVIQQVVPENYVRILYLYGNSGTGKSRLMVEVENKAYENAYRVIHIDFREKSDIAGLQDLVIALLNLPSTKNKIRIDNSEFIAIFEKTLDKESINTLYNFLYQESKEILYNQLTNSIINILASTPTDNPILIGLDNIQEMSHDIQIMIWNILEHFKTISLPICFMLSHNQERYQGNKNILVEYLKTIGENKENFILSYECDVLLLQDANILMRQLLHLSLESEEYVNEILKKNGTSPMDILILAKELSQSENIFKKIGNSRYIINPTLLIEYSSKISTSTDLLINSRLKNMESKIDSFDKYWDFFSILCHFDGNLPYEIFEESKLDKEILYNTNQNLITKSNYKENIITFYHEKLFRYFVKQNLCVSNALLKIICNCYNKYQNENIVSSYINVKTLLALKQTETAIVQGLETLAKYQSQHQNLMADLICNLLLETIHPQNNPVQYFNILFIQADIWLESVNVSNAERLFEKAKKILIDNLALFNADVVTHFFHRYVNQKLHMLQYEKAVIALEEFEQLKGLSLKASMIIDDRYCVAFYSLGKEKEALDRINKVILSATDQKDYTWLSIAYSDKAFTHFFNSRNIEQTILNFTKAIEYHAMSDEKDSLSRKIEIYIQSAIVHILKNEIDDAITCMQQSIHFAKENNQGYLLIPSFNIYAYLLVLQGKTDESIELLKTALSYANTFSNEKALISIYNNLGNIYIERCEFTQALDYYNVSFQILKRICLPSNNLRYNGFICNIIKLCISLNDEQLLEEVSTYYDISSLNKYIKAFKCMVDVAETGGTQYGLLAINGWDYLYY